MARATPATDDGLLTRVHVRARDRTSMIGRTLDGRICAARLARTENFAVQPCGTREDRLLAFVLSRTTNDAYTSETAVAAIRTVNDARGCG